MNRRRAYVAAMGVTLAVCAGLQLNGRGLQLNLLVLGAILAPGLVALLSPSVASRPPAPRLQRALELVTLLGCAQPLQPGWSMAAALGALLVWSLPRAPSEPAPPRLAALSRPALALAVVAVCWQASRADALTGGLRLLLL